MNLRHVSLSVLMLGVVLAAVAYSQDPPGEPDAPTCEATCAVTNFFQKEVAGIETYFRVACEGGCRNYWWTSPGDSAKVAFGVEVTYPKYKQNEGALCVVTCDTFVRNVPNGAEFLAQCSVDDFAKEASGSHDCYQSSETVTAKCDFEGGNDSGVPLEE